MIEDSFAFGKGLVKEGIVSMSHSTLPVFTALFLQLLCYNVSVFQSRSRLVWQ
jgi:hypothetical protein